jgi:hypothetical protein
LTYRNYSLIIGLIFLQFLIHEIARTKKSPSTFLTLASGKVDGPENHSGENAEETLLLSYLSGEIHVGAQREVITIERYETTDIFIGAFFLSMGGSLSGIRIKDAARGIAAFEISGEDLDRLDREYRSGQALVNPVQLRESLNLLRDMLFDLREVRRRRDDRARKNRRDQK